MGRDKKLRLVKFNAAHLEELSVEDEILTAT